MATVVGNLRVLLSADAAEFSKDMKRAERELLASADRMSKVGDTLTRKVTLPLTLLGAASIKLASDAAESASKFETVFGAAADEMTAFIRDVQDVIPATRKELQDMTSGLHDLLVPMGVVPGEAVKMDQAFVRLAGDLASFNNLRVEDVLADLRSGIVGQSEPLLKYGIDVRAAAVKTKALELGLISASGEMTNAARAQAVLAIAVEQSTFAIGDAGRTAGSTSNQLKFFLRDTKELGTEIGNVLLPVVNDLLRLLNGLLRGLRDVDPLVLKIAVGFGVLAAALGPVLSGMAGLLRLAVALRGASALGGLATLLAGGGGLIVGLGLLAGGFLLAANNIGSLSRQARETIGDLKELQSTLAAMTREQLGQALAANTASLAETRRQIDETQAKIDRLKAGPQVPGGGILGTSSTKDQLRGLDRELRSLQATEAEYLKTHQAIVASYGRFNQVANTTTTITTDLGGATSGVATELASEAAALREVNPVLEEYVERMIELDRAQRQTLRRHAEGPSLAKGARDAADEYAKITRRSREDDIARQVAEFQRLEQAARGMAETVGDAFFSVVTGSKDLLSAIRDMVSGILQELLRLAIQRAIVVPLFNAITSAFGGGGSLVPGRAAGGPVASGRPYLVGENGPELFVPGASGSIVPNGAMAAGGTNYMPINLIVKAWDSRDVSRWLRGGGAKLISDSVAGQSARSLQSAHALGG